MSNTSTVAEELASFACSLRFDQIPTAVRSQAALQLLDTVGVARAAARLGAAPAVTHIASAAARCDPGGQVIGQDGTIDLPVALLVNGTLAHALDFDNTHTGSMVHVGAAVGPMSWTLGSSIGAPGQEVVRAYVAGVECAARLGAAAPGAFHRSGFHATSVVGIFGAVIAASVLVDAAPDQVVHALGIAGSLAAGLLEYHTAGTSNKQLHPGLAARDAYVAVQLGLAGAEGPASVFEGPFGVFATHLRTLPASFGTESLGHVWETAQVTTKPYPACNLVHFALDCMDELRDRIEVGRISRVEIRGAPEIVPLVIEPAAAKIQPRSAYEAKFSMQHCVARFAIDGELRVDSFTAAAVAEHPVEALARRVEFVPDEDTGYPRRLGGSVTVVLDDGTELHAAAGDPRGTPGRPLDPEQIVDKFVANAAPDERVAAAALADRLLCLADAQDVAPLYRACSLPELRDVHVRRAG